MSDIKSVRRNNAKQFLKPTRKQQNPASGELRRAAAGGCAGVWENPVWEKDTGNLSASRDKRLEKKGASQWMVLKMGWKTGETGPLNEKPRKCLFCWFSHCKVLLPPTPPPWPLPQLISLGSEKRLLVVIPSACCSSTFFYLCPGLAVGKRFQMPEIWGFTLNLSKMGIWEMSVYIKITFSSR